MSQSKKDKMRNRLVIEQGGKCAYCDHEFELDEKVVLDHIVPRSKEGVDGKRNRAATCVSCDKIKAGFYCLEEAMVRVNSLREHAMMLEHFFTRLRIKGIC